MKKRTFFIICMFQPFVTLPLQAPLPPEALDLREFKTDHQPIDQKLKQWFDWVDGLKHPTLTSESEFNTQTKGFGPASLAYTELRRAADQSPNQRQVLSQTIGKRYLQEIETNGQPWKNDPLYPYFLQFLYSNKVDGFDENQKKQFKDNLRSIPDRTCPNRSLLVQDIQNEGKKIDIEKAKHYLAQIGSYRSKRFQERSLEALLANLDKEKHSSLKTTLTDLMRPYPRLVSTYDWVIEKQEVKSEDEKINNEPFRSFKRVEDSIVKKQCNEAFTSLKSGMRLDKRETKDLKLVEVLVNKVDSCFRRSGLQARLNYLNKIRPELGTAYGFPGEEMALRPKGLIYWGRDEFEKARDVFNYLLEHPQSKEFKEIESRTLYTFARIEENQGRLKEAIEKYKAFISRFPDDEKISDSLTSLVVLSSVSSNENEALTFARQMIDREYLKDIEDRDTSYLSFALFWAGRLSLSTGQSVRAYEYWRRLASEYYSTFYGALGHFMLENLAKKTMILQPTYVRSFNWDQLKSAFPAEDQGFLKRADLLLTLGLKDEAACEIQEIEASPNDDVKTLVKSMYLYAAGDWLEAIKDYGLLSKAFRHSLPLGMERLLFPRAYMDTIHNFAKQLDIEEDFILGIIRQESVFNPRAMSPVGARGLMQLMPATARQEARKLSRTYLDSKMRKDLLQRATNPSNLLDAETNLAIGIHHVFSLYKRYKNPIYVLTSYNANPRATEKWLANIDSHDMLAFIERIPYRETQAYVKLVMRNYFYYNRWYRFGPDASTPFMEQLAPKVVELARRESLKGSPWSTQ